jgi:hypothetical protein
MLMSVTENIQGEGVGDLFRPDDYPPALPPIRRGTQARIPLKVALIGGGQACADLLTLLVEERLGRLGLEILGVADPNPEAPGIRQARQLGIFTTSDFNQLYQGTGLGLPVTEKMVKEQGGRLTAESSPGQGSVFTIRLPLREKRQEPAHDR